MEDLTMQEIYAGNRVDDSVPSVKSKSYQILLFQLENEAYAVSVHQVQEIVAYQPVTRVPQSSGCLLGMVNLRGSIIPVFNLRLKFELPEITPTNHHVIIVLQLQKKLIGILADAVHSVEVISEKDILMPSLSQKSKVQQFLTGICRISEKLILILEIEKVLAEELGLLQAEESEDGVPASNDN